MLKQLMKGAFNAADDVVLTMDRRAATPDCVVNVLFHSLCESPGELRNPALAPGLTVTVPTFAAFIEEMLENGYTAVSPIQIDAGLEPGRRYFSITFDDGYFNNGLAVDVLERFRVPATFFISTGHVQQNKAFWWDALSRHLSRGGIAAQAQKAEVAQLKALTPARIEAALLQRFGASMLQPVGDFDRPFTPMELAAFARSPWVHVGNHTRDHAILTNCTPEEMFHQIQACQDALAELVGSKPIAIAYPNGNCSPDTVDAAVAAGLRLGFTVAPHRSRLPLASGPRMTLGRFQFDGTQDVRRQCRLFGARFVPSHAMKMLMRATSY